MATQKVDNLRWQPIHSWPWSLGKGQNPPTVSSSIPQGRVVPAHSGSFMNSGRSTQFLGRERQWKLWRGYERTPSLGGGVVTTSALGTQGKKKAEGCPVPMLRALAAHTATPPMPGSHPQKGQSLHAWHSRPPPGISMPRPPGRSAWAGRASGSGVISGVQGLGSPPKLAVARRPVLPGLLQWVLQGTQAPSVTQTLIPSCQEHSRSWLTAETGAHPPVPPTSTPAPPGVTFSE